MELVQFLVEDLVLPLINALLLLVQLVLSVWLENAYQEDVDRLVHSNLIVLEMEIALIVLVSMVVLHTVEDNVLVTLIVEETLMDVDRVSTDCALKVNVVLSAFLKVTTLAILPTVAPSVIPLLLLLTLVLLECPAMLLVK